MLLVDLVPSQGKDFVSPSARKCEEANCSYHPWRAALFLLSLVQGIAQAAKFRLAKEAFAPPLPIFFDMTAGIRAIGPETVFFSPIE
jgi:hypothetical protein